MEISIVIPALNEEAYIVRLLISIEMQSLPPKEIIIVDSSKSNKTELIVRNRQATIPIIYKRVDFAYAGHARNVGVALASSEWIAFLDCRKIPDTDWLERCSSVALQMKVDFVMALFIGTADSHFSQIVLAATYGNVGVRTVPGSLISKSVFDATGGFFPHVRAGEDIEWMNRLVTNGAKIAYLETPTVRYEGLPSSLGFAIRKWNKYAISNALINVRTQQKVIYGGILLLLMLFFVYRWNGAFARWRVNSALYMPHITKIFVASIVVSYSVYRGIIRPLIRKVKPSFLFPVRWLQVLFVGLCLDITKAPGLLLGVCMLVRKWLTP